MFSIFRNFVFLPHMVLRNFDISSLNTFILLPAFAMIFFACETEDAPPVFMGQEYFGQTPGKWIIYDVDSTVYDDFLGEIFHYQYQVLEWNKETYINSQDEEAMRLERFWRKNDGQQWKMKNIWNSVLLDNKAKKTEENITYVKLAFPLKENQRWDGNAYNTREEKPYTVTQIHQPIDLPNHKLDSTLTVLHIDFQTLIGEELKYEIYSKHVGMVIRKYKELEKEVDGTIIRGVDYTYTLVDYGIDENLFQDEMTFR